MRFLLASTIEENTMFDYELVREAGVKPRHISRILSISRVTASNWLRGVTKPHHLVKAQAAQLSQAVKLATEAEELPVSDQIPPEERSVKTVSIVKRYLMEIDADEESPEYT